MRSVCVFCGSSGGNRPTYVEAAVTLGQVLAARGLRLVYGGGRVGLMGALADAVLTAGGQVVGVIPRALVDRELAHQGVTELHVVETMHQRKALMTELSDAFVALPGGIGTLEELFEVLSWAQLGFHHKPCGVLDVDNYYRGLVQLLDHTVDEGFVAPEHRALVAWSNDAEGLLDHLANRRGPPRSRWIDRKAT